MEKENRELLQIAENFMLQGKIERITPHGNGHINDTYLVFCMEGQEEYKYVLQRINHEVFKKPEEVMENVENITSFLREKIQKEGGDPERETLNVVPAKTGASFCRAEDGTYWRVYHFVEGASSYDMVTKPEDFYESGVAFGHFQKMLEDFPAEKLHETIPNFHNTVNRFDNFKKALEADMMHRAEEVQEEIRFVLEREKDCHVICDGIDSGEIPLRVTHNDTKINNIMMDNETGKGICVIDLDTVMPGTALYDYGDAIRAGASTGEEDEKDLSKISCSLELFELYTKGYIEGCEGALTDTEIKLFPMGAKLMTLECGMRFLTDYLEGDHYFKIHRPEHNLDRARTQFKLVKDMEEKWDKLQEIAQRYAVSR